MLEIITGRDDPENLRILKKTSSGIRLLKVAVGFCGCDDICVEIFDTTRCVVREAGVSA